MKTLVLQNRQRGRKIHAPLGRRLLRTVLESLAQLPQYALGVHLVDRPEITALNERFLQHQGPTDVLAFDHRDPQDPLDHLHGEIFICVAEAERQARRFRTTWTAELVRYLVHGVLHLRGYDDRTALARARMKRVEDRWLSHLRRQYRFDELESRRSGPPQRARRPRPPKSPPKVRQIACPLSGLRGPRRP